MDTIVTILITILMIGILVFVHELGHFTFAKLFGVRVYEFSLGMGPRLCGFEKNGTKYNLRLFPVGGYVSMKGEDEKDADNKSELLENDPYNKADNSDSVNNKPNWQRFIILFAGAAMNVLAGFIAAIVMVIISGPIAGTTVSQINLEQTTADKFQVGDRIIEINGYDILSSRDVSFAFMRTNDAEATKYSDVTIDATVIREGKKTTLHSVKLYEADKDGKDTNVFYVNSISLNVFTVVKEALFTTVSLVKLVYFSLFDLITGNAGLGDMSGIIGVGEQVGVAISMGLKTVLFLFALIAVNFGVFNMLPLPALDGGRCFFVLIAAIIRKRIPPEKEGIVHFIGLIFFLALIVFVSFNDIVRLFS